jgi:3-hydroxyisobutyrate dehydrogenase-like beta-hydroxyacid dehydrogenase
MNAITSTPVGFIGLGLMGQPMARRLHAAGAVVTVHNRSQPAAEALRGEGMQVAPSPASLVRPGGTTVLMLTDTPAVDSVVHGPRGLLAGLAALPAGTPAPLIIDMGTTAVEATRRLADSVIGAGGAWLDAPVSGGVLGARDGTLSIMVGGARDDVTRARPVLQVMGATITHVGDVGAGQVAKAANQVIVGLNIAAVAEALTLARAAGVDPARVCAALSAGFAASRVLEVHGPRMTAGRFEPGARATTQHKDMQQALDLAAALGVDLPSTRLNRDLYQRLIDQGDGALDHSALIRLFSGGEHTT